MRKLPFLLVLGSLLVAASGASAQTSGVTTSTDPARAAEVERHAQMLQDQRGAKAPVVDKSMRPTKRHHMHHAPARHDMKHKKAMTRQ